MSRVGAQLAASEVCRLLQAMCSTFAACNDADRPVYELYGLTEEDIRIVEGVVQVTL